MWRGLFLLGVLSSCVPLESGPPCEESPSDTPRCCDPERYAAVALTELAAGTTAWLGREVETQGIADWYTTRDGRSDCTCANNVCSCVVPLGLRSAACGDLIRLGGELGGRPVECAQDGCWPLQPLFAYSVCGSWQWDHSAPMGGEGTLALTTFCQL